MQGWLLEHYSMIKAFHIIAMISWMAAMLYLPRLYIYHCAAEIGSVQSETFKVMERRLLRAICNPAMIATFLFGILMLYANPDLMKQGWVHAKLLLVLILGAVHGLFSKWRKYFEKDINTRSAVFYRYWNEVPTVIMIAVVILAVVKPF